MENLIEISNLSVSCDVRAGLLLRKIGTIKAVNEASFSIGKGEILGVVGESGCGKSTLARLVLRLIEPDSGSVVFNGNDILKMPKKELRQERRHMQMVFQDPYSAMDPRYTIFRSLSEPFQIQNVAFAEGEKRKKIDDLLRLVGLNPEHGFAYPHALSGGQKQRVDIARVLALTPQFIILDEPTAALDVSVQAQIIKLLEGLRERLNLTFLFTIEILAIQDPIFSIFSSFSIFLKRKSISILSDSLNTTSLFNPTSIACKIIEKNIPIFCISSSFSISF